MMSIILILLILIWLFLFLLLRWKWNRTLAADFPLFLFCMLLLVTRIAAYTKFGENRQIGLSIAWLPALYWLYIRNHDVAFLFSFKPLNIITGCLIGAILGVGAVGIAAFFIHPSTSIGTSQWIPGLIFDSIQRSILEEIVFRCLLLNYLGKYISNNFFLNLLQGFIFGIFHLYGVYLQSPILLLMPLGIGLLSGFMVLKQKSIYGSLLAHTLYNLIQGLAVAS